MYVYIFILYMKNAFRDVLVQEELDAAHQTF